MKTILYRYFDSEGRLLYVGITGNQLKRQSQHRRSSLWFDQIASAKFEHFQSREEAEVAEVRAIQDEKPTFNQQHTKWKLEENWEVLDFAAKLHLLTTLNGTDMRGKPSLIDDQHRQYQTALQSYDFQQYGLSLDENLVLGLLEIWMDLYLTAPNFENCYNCKRIFETDWFNETYTRAEGRLEKEGDSQICR